MLFLTLLWIAWKGSAETDAEAANRVCKLAAVLTMSRPKRDLRKRNRASVPAGYTKVLADVKRLIAESRHRALATVNRELVCLYWHIGRIIVQQQEHAKWGDAVVEQLSADLRMAFPDMKGFSRDNVPTNADRFSASLGPVGAAVVA